mgnify:CR=1
DSTPSLEDLLHEKNSAGMVPKAFQDDLSFLEWFQGFFKFSVSWGI